MSHRRRTRILCTIGPASANEQVMEALFDAGMDVARLNFSHGTHQDHRSLFERLRRLSDARGQFLAILQDLSGPKIRLGTVAPGTVLTEGSRFILTSEPVEGSAEMAQVTYPRLAEEVSSGHGVLLDDGLLALEVERVEGTRVLTRVRTGGPISSGKGVNLPHTRLSVQALTEKDEADLRFGLELGVDYVALSFVRHPKDVEAVRRIMAEVGVYRPVIAKIEKPEAVEAIEGIVQAFDGVMVARGDLGVEMPIEKIPGAQKRIIALARRYYKPVITATQMLDSMIRNPRPTRAEVTDIANAILDGTDAVMLSGETASGSYPVEAVRVMDRVAREAETCLPFEQVYELGAPKGAAEEAVALAACEIAEVVDARALVACTTSGGSVRRVSHFRPRAPIMGVAHDEVVARQLSLLFGVVPCHISNLTTADDLVVQAAMTARRYGVAEPGDRVVVVAGIPPGKPTNLVHLFTLPPQA